MSGSIEIYGQVGRPTQIICGGCQEILLQGPLVVPMALTGHLVSCGSRPVSATRVIEAIEQAAVNCDRKSSEGGPGQAKVWDPERSKIWRNRAQAHCADIEIVRQILAVPDLDLREQGD